MGIYIPTTETLAVTVPSQAESHGHEETAGQTRRWNGSVTQISFSFTTFVVCKKIQLTLLFFLHFEWRILPHFWGNIFHVLPKLGGNSIATTVFFFSFKRQFSDFSFLWKVTSYLTQVPPFRQGRCWQTGGSQFLMFLPLTASPAR